MELFDEIVECEVGMVTPHLPDLIQFSLQVASNVSLGDNIRVKALSFLQWLASLKKKVSHSVCVCVLRACVRACVCICDVVCDTTELAQARPPPIHYSYHADDHGHASS